MQKGGIAKFLELRKQSAAGAAHRVHHFLAEADRGRHRFGVATENVAEVDVEHLA